MYFYLFSGERDEERIKGCWTWVEAYIEGSLYSYTRDGGLDI